MVQIAGMPLSFCQRISDLPSPLKSAAAATCHVGPGIGQDRAAADQVGAVHGPDRGLAAVVLPKNVGLAVAVEIGRVQRHARSGPGLGRTAPPPIRLVPSMVQIAGMPLSFCQRMSDLPSPLKSAAVIDMPRRPRIGQDRPPPVMLVPSMVQIAGMPLSFCQRMSDLPSPLKSAAVSDMPRGPRIGQDGAASDVGAVHGPDRRQAAVVLPKNIGLAVAVEVVGRYQCGGGQRRCRLGRIENDLHAIARMNAVELRDGRPVCAIGCAILVDLQDCGRATRIFQHPDKITDRLAAARR